jgi:hypothetical protein
VGFFSFLFFFDNSARLFASTDSIHHYSVQINYTKLDEDTLWSGPELMSVFGPLADKLHITVDKLKKLLHSPFLTNQAITRPVLSCTVSFFSASVRSSYPSCLLPLCLYSIASSSPSPPPSGNDGSSGASGAGPSPSATSAAAMTDAAPASGASTAEGTSTNLPPALNTGGDVFGSGYLPMGGLDQTKEILLSLKQAQEEAEELHPKGHRTICISRCLSTLFMYLSGDLPEAEALKKIEEATKEIEQFWVNERYPPLLLCPPND